uniref:Uncharacterized protein n=1 Tax=Glossina pallidipes TaxID=7398 RepID=A0A1B0AHY1_GLOPL
MLNVDNKFKAGSDSVPSWGIAHNIYFPELAAIFFHMFVDMRKEYHVGDSISVTCHLSISYPLLKRPFYKNVNEKPGAQVHFEYERNPPARMLTMANMGNSLIRMYRVGSHAHKKQVEDNMIKYSLQ